MSNAIPPVLIQFATGGLRDVDRAFATLEQRMAGFERGATREQEAGSRARVRSAQSEADQRERAYNKLQREVAREEDKFTRSAEREAEKRVRLAKKEDDERERAFQRMVREMQREEERLTATAKREAEKREAAAMRVRRAVGHETTGAMGRVFGGAAAAVGAVTAIGGGFMLADAARGQLNSERAAALLVNSATIGGQAPAGATTANVLAKASVASREFGVDKTDLIGAVQNYVAKSSDFSGGLENMGFFAKLSKATGSKLEDITGAAGILRAQNKNLSAGDMRQMLLDLVEQGKQGAVEISDLASSAGALGSTRGLYKGSQTDNQRKLLALAQITRTEGASAEDAATAVKDLGEEAIKKSVGKHAPQWLKDVTKGGTIDSPEALLEAGLLGTKGNQAQLLDVFGARGMKAFQRLAPIFNDAGGGQAGIAAVRAEMAPIMGAHGTAQQLDQQFDVVMSAPAEKLAKAFNNLKDVVSTALEPWLQRFADTLPGMLPSIERFIDRVGEISAYLANNPLGGIASVLGIALTAEIGKAAIPTLLEKAISTRLGGELAIAAATIALGEAVINIASEAEQHRQRQVVAESNEAVNLASQLTSEARTGTVKPEHLAAAQQQAKALAAEIESREPSDVADPLSGYVPNSDSQTAGERKNFQQGLQALTDALHEAAQAERSRTPGASTSPANPANSLPIDQRPSH